MATLGRKRLHDVELIKQRVEEKRRDALNIPAADAGALAAISAEITTLEGELDTLTTAHNTLSGAHDDLATAHNTLSNAHNAVADDVDVINDKLVDTSLNNSIVRYDGVAGKHQTSDAYITDDGKITVHGVTNKGKFSARSNSGTEVLTISENTGKGLINLVEPTDITGQPLKVKSDIRIEGPLEVDPLNGAVGKVLTSDADGLATWQDNFDLPNYGIQTSNFTLPAGGGRVTIDCTGGIRSAVLPSATGSQDVYIISFINVNFLNYGSINFQGGNTLNQVDYNQRHINDLTKVIIDAAPSKYMTEGVQQVRNLTLHVPSQFATIQEALDAAPGFISSDNTIWIQLAPGDHYLNGNSECSLRCRHWQEVIIRGSSGQYPPRYENGTDTTFPCVSREVDKDHALTLGGSILHIDSTGNGIRLEHAPTVSFRYLQLRDNKNGTPYTTPSNYIFRDSRVRGFRQFDRLLIVGSVYGMYFEGVGHIYMTYTTMLHQVNRGCYISRGTFLNTYRYCAWGVNYGIYYGTGALGTCVRIQVKGNTAVNTGAGRGVYVNGANVYLTYPQVECINECIYVFNKGNIEVAMTSNTAAINKTVLKGSRIVYANNARVAMSSGGASANCDIVSSGTSYLYAYKSYVSLGTNLTNSDTPVPVNRVCHIRDCSIGYGGAATGLTLSPLLGVELVLSRWAT